MVKIRLWRSGAIHKPIYRIVAADSRVKRDGKYIEQIGFYNPLNDDVKVDNDVAIKWLKNGAQPTNTVRQILSKKGIIQKFKNQK